MRAHYSNFRRSHRLLLLEKIKHRRMSNNKKKSIKTIPIKCGNYGNPYNFATKLIPIEPSPETVSAYKLNPKSVWTSLEGILSTLNISKLVTNCVGKLLTYFSFSTKLTTLISKKKHTIMLLSGQKRILPHSLFCLPLFKKKSN